MADLNDALVNIIERTTGDKIRESEELDVNDPDKELLLALLKVLTLMSQRMLDQTPDVPENATPQDTIGGVVPFVS